MNHLPRLSLAAAAIGMTALAGCSDATGTSGARPVTLSFSTAGSTAGISASVASAAADSLVITKAQLVFSKAELEQVNASCTSNEEEGDDDGCAEMKLGPMLVDLPLTAGTKSTLSVPVPAGTYDKFHGKIDAVESESDGPRQSAATFLAAHPEFRNVSIRVEGTYRGQPFVYTSRMDTELEIEFNPPLAVNGSTSNITVDVDLATWFRARDGSTVNPALANEGGAYKSLVDENIKRSFKVFEDDDRDGHDD